jgi:TolA-binding protein
VQYGLIAEEVAKVYPELVIHGAGGSIDGVRYEELAPMLLYEVQQQRQQLRAMQRQMVEMRATLVKLRAQDQLVAQR